MQVSAFIAGCLGPVLSEAERAFFRDAQPWGFILFGRNVQTPGQVAALVASFREAVGRDDAPVLIDQEGGRVQRLGPPHWPAYPAGRAYGSMAANDPLTRRELTRLGARLIAHDLRLLGINVDCVPVLDVPVAGSHRIIGDRAYGDEPVTVAVLGRATAEGLIAGGVLPVIKHIPGHGRALSDSHEALPRVSAPIGHLEHVDFRPFRHLADMPLAMTAHIVYEAIDPDHPATNSARVIRDVIRGRIGFDGLLMSDDLSMRALQGSYRERAEVALKAGCDVVLHCNGDMAQMQAVAEGSRPLRGRARRRAESALARIRHEPEPFDVAEARSRLSARLAAVA